MLIMWMVLTTNGLGHALFKILVGGGGDDLVNKQVRFEIHGGILG